VDEGKRGVELRLGRYVQTTQPGPRWHWPYPFESAEVVNVSQVQAVEIGHRNNQKTKVREESLMMTEDQNIVDVQFAVQYTLKSPEEYLFINRNPDEAVRQVGETAMREIVGKSKMDFVLYEGREQIAVKASNLMQEILDRYQTGILISKVTMQNAQPPEQVQSAFDDAVKSGQDRERQINEGQAYANDVIPKAQGTAARLKQEADGYKQRLIATAEGDASRFKQINAEYAKAPEVTRSRMYIETMQQIYASTSKVMVDSKGQGNLLYLPLDKLMQAAGGLVASPESVGSSAEMPAQVRSGPVISNETPPQVVDKTDLRSRDALRSRDREVR
jgi:membrane protease subunit HflK